MVLSVTSLMFSIRTARYSRLLVTLMKGCTSYATLALTYSLKRSPNCFLMLSRPLDRRLTMASTMTSKWIQLVTRNSRPLRRRWSSMSELTMPWFGRSTTTNHSGRCFLQTNSNLRLWTTTSAMMSGLLPTVKVTLLICAVDHMSQAPLICAGSS